MPNTEKIKSTSFAQLSMKPCRPLAFWIGISISALHPSAMAKKTLMAKVEMTSRFGVLKVLNVNDEQQLFIGRQPLSMSNHSLGIKEKWEIGKKDIFLVSSDSGGNFCPILYSLITVEKLLVNVSAPFGNCGDWLKVKRLGDRIILRFDRWNRENPAVLVKFDGGVISEGRRTVNVTKLARLCPRHGKI